MFMTFQHRTMSRCSKPHLNPSHARKSPTAPSESPVLNNVVVIAYRWSQVPGVGPRVGMGLDAPEAACLWARGTGPGPLLFLSFL